jgi:hypothetical protein
MSHPFQALLTFDLSCAACGLYVLLYLAVIFIPRLSSLHSQSDVTFASALVLHLIVLAEHEHGFVILLYTPLKAALTAIVCLLHTSITSRPRPSCS